MIFGDSFEEGPMVIDPRHPGFTGLSGTISCIAKRQHLEKNSEIRSWQPFRKESAIGNFGAVMSIAGIPVQNNGLTLALFS